MRGPLASTAHGMMRHLMERVLSIRARLLATVSRLPLESVALADAGGRWLGGEVRARSAAPPFTCSAMDGFAVRASEVPGPVALPVRRNIYAGDPPGTLAPGEAAPR
jgi:molybdopterin molybdotransferase